MLKQEDLTQFIGTETWYQHSLNKNVTYTDGVRYVAKEGGAYWLIDKIAIMQMEPKIKAEEFQVWTLKVKDDKGDITCDDGNGNIVFEEHINFTDFPLDEIKFYFTNGVILLPSEY